MYNQKLSYAVFISLLLHLTVIVMLFVGVMSRSNVMNSGHDGESIDAIMVDPAIAQQQYARQQKQQQASIEAEKKRQAQLQAQESQLQREQAAQRKKLVELEQQRLEAEEATQKAEAKKREEEYTAKLALERKQAEEAAAQRAVELRKIAEDEQKKQEAAAKLAEQKRKEEEAATLKATQAKKAAEEEALRLKEELDKQKKALDEQLRQAEKEKADRARAEQAQNDAKKKAEDEKKRQAKAEADKYQKELNSLLDDLLSTPTETAVSGGRLSGDSSEVNAYLAQIRNAIQRRFKDPQLYRGKTCTLRIQLARDGLLLNVKSEGGDTALCREAVNALRQANIPAPPSQKIYEQFKNVAVDFKPE